MGRIHSRVKKKVLFHIRVLKFKCGGLIYVVFMLTSVATGNGLENG